MIIASALITTGGPMNLPLIIAGNGSHRFHLESIAKDNVKFVGRVSDEDLLKYYQNCKAFVYPAEEDFGIVPVEAMAAGKPIIAYNKGGLKESVIEGKTGVFFNRDI